MSYFLYNETLAISLIIINFYISQIKNPDPIENLDEINNSLDQIEDEDIKEKMTNFINNLIDNPMLSILFMFIVYSIPLLNIYILYKTIKELNNLE